MPADLEARRRALDPAASFIVQAPAGSGKTEVLTQRFLRLLATVDRPERVLAITFTRKATQEMRTRITRRLAQASAGEVPHEPYERVAVELADRVLARDRERGWDLLGNPGRLRITTIDGLCAQILARDPLLGPRWAGAHVLEDARPLYREAVARVFSDLEELAGAAGTEAREMQDSLVRLLVYLGGDGRRLEGLLMEMLRRRSLWNRHIRASHEQLEALLRHRQQGALDAFLEALGASSFEEAVGLARGLGLVLPEAHEDPEASLRHAFSLARVFSTREYKPRKPRSVTPSLFPEMSPAQQPAFDRLKEIYCAWVADAAAVEALEFMASWPPLDDSGQPGFGRDSILDDARRVSVLALAELDSVMADTGQVDFTAISDAALTALGGDTRPGEVLLAEDARIDHILMDEFQDTSHLQFGLLERLIEGWQPGDGRSLFLVGDPMQSIYRFREANVGFFNEVAAQGRIGQVSIEPLRLTANFRSRGELVDWFNETFLGVFPDHDASDSGAVAYSPASAEQSGGGVVVFHALAGDDAGSSEPGHVADLVADAQSALGDPSIAILVRSRNQVPAITQALSRRDIAHETVQIGKLAGRAVVRDLVALARALSHPLDRIAWIALLRAPWCGLGIADIHRVVGEDPAVAVLESIEAAVREGALEPGLLDRLGRLARVARRANRLASGHSLADRVQMCWIELGGPLCCTEPADLANAESCLALLEEVERSGGAEVVERLEEALEIRFASSRPARVQVMTIHKAKGLEFDVVIVPGLERKTGGNRDELITVQEFRGDGQAGVLMAPLTTRAQAEVSLYRYLSRVDAERDRYEAQRVLYVACTRARTQLHLLATAKANRSGEASVRADTFLKLLEAEFQPHLEAAIGGLEETASPAETDEAGVTALPLWRLADLPPPLELPPLDDAPPEPGPLPKREAVALGTVVHRWLELIHDHPEPPWDGARIARSARAIRGSLARAGAPESSLDALQDRCIAVLTRALDDPGVMRWLGRQGPRESWSELALLQRQGDDILRHVIDLLVRDEAGRLRIIDYKTASPPGGGDDRRNWEEQLARYRALVDRLDAGEVAEAAVSVLAAEPAKNTRG